ncbi:MAG: protoporphyrinogen oxidase [Candidatus Omnitrophica bacterium]|nr:protoporphyrinogen oxidase [Candidatus Omnitrophota bacterium]
MKRVAIVGAGVSGLACAHRLGELAAKAGTAMEISVFDAASRAGGTIASEEKDGFLLEKGPDSFISEKPWAVELSGRLGIGPEILGTEGRYRKTFVVKGGRLLPLPEGFYLVAPLNPVSFLGTPLFSWAGKLRMMSEVWVPRKTGSADESVADFIRRRFGKEALERVGQPMVAGIHSGDPGRLSLSEVLPRFKALEENHGSVIRGLLKSARSKDGHSAKAASGPRYSLFLSYRRGMETLVRALVDRLPGGTLRLGSGIRRISREHRKGAWNLTGQDGGTYPADAVCLACPAHRAADLVEDLSPDVSKKLREIPYESVATVNLAYREEDVAHPLDGFGFVVPAVERKSLVACTFANRKFAGRAPKGFLLLRAFVGGAFGKEFFEMPDGDLQKSVGKDLAALLGIRKDPLFCRISRWRESMAQYRVGHRDRIRRIESLLGDFPGIFLTGSAYRGTGIPDCIHNAEQQAEAVFPLLTKEGNGEVIG